MVASVKGAQKGHTFLCEVPKQQDSLITAIPSVGGSRLEFDARFCCLACESDSSLIRGASKFLAKASGPGGRAEMQGMHQGTFLAFHTQPLHPFFCIFRDHCFSGEFLYPDFGTDENADSQAWPPI